MLLRESLLKTDGVRMPLKLLWAPHGAHNHRMETPALHAFCRLYRLISSYEINPGPRSLRFALLSVLESPNTISFVGDSQKDA